MRILYCNKYNFPFSGTEVYLFELMQMMREQGHEAALFSMADPRGQPSEFDRFQVPHVDFKQPGHSPMTKARLALHSIYSLESRQRLRRLVEEFRPDVAHVRNIYHHLSPSILWELKRQRVPVIYHLNDFKLLCPTYNMVNRSNTCTRCQGGQYWRMLREDCYHWGRTAGFVLATEAYVHRWLRTYDRCIDRFLAPSEFVRTKLIENGWAADKIDVLPHFQRITQSIPADPAPDAPILYFGRLSPEKGVEDLLRAMQKLPHIRLKIAGDGPLHDELVKLARQLRLQNVHFLGQVQGADLDHLIEESRFTVFPSHAYETLGKTILESYAHGRAVVASDLGSRRELVKHAETGLLYQAGNIEELTLTISFLWERAHLVASMGRAGREVVRQRHSPENHYAGITRLYQQVISTITPQPQACALVPRPKPRLRIAFIGGRGVIGKYSGIEGYYEEVGSRLAQAGHSVTIYCRTYFTPPQRELHGMRLVRLPTVRSKHFESVIHTLLSTVHVSFRPCDIVQYHTLGSALFSWIPRIAGKKTVVCVQGLDWQRKKWGRLASAVLRVGEKASASCPDATLVASRTLQTYYRKHYGLRTVYVPNGARMRERRSVSLIRKWGIEPGNYALFLGRFSPEKNCHLLIEAFERLDSAAQLVMAGGSLPSDPYAKQLYRHCNDRIRLMNYVSGEAFEEMLTNAMLFVLPSDIEGLSLALLEAMGAGLCVLASDIPENRELVDGAGFTFKKGDVADLERMLHLLINDPEARKEAGRRAKRRIQEEYLWEKIAAQVEQVYINLYGWKQGPRARSHDLVTLLSERGNAAWRESA